MFKNINIRCKTENWIPGIPRGPVRMGSPLELRISQCYLTTFQPNLKGELKMRFEFE